MSETVHRSDQPLLSDRSEIFDESDDATVLLRGRRPSVFTAALTLDADTAHVAISGELDIATTPLLEQAFALCHDNDRHRVAVDVRRLDLLSAAGAEALLREADYDRRQGGSLWLHGDCRPVVQRVLRMADIPTTDAR